MIVADTNTIFCLFLERPETPQAVKILDRDPDWVAPVFWRIEFLNILSNHCKFAGLSPVKASDIWQQAADWKHLREGPVDHYEALNLSIKHRISVYDALFVTLAKNLGVVCVTQDKVLRKAVPHLTVSMDDYLK